ncbi:hypothetical protein BGZ96_007064 [Linnemannia gamsii]|uniref:Zn(2)-C6 fungal-type domain-containing protein n=1 Tax=Linnemannia gamsii TaxID=64522 RepID=A0ABQ7K1H7_9FUNG|nr:hypothetical protein BGZ96_007064 [Linnemannia gamsii]
MHQATTSFFLQQSQFYSPNLHQQQQQQNLPPPPPPPNTPTTQQKRTYVTRACDHCRQRRAVCDNQKPKCSRCQKKKIDCTFLVPQRKRGPIAKTRSDSGLDPNQEQDMNIDLNQNNHNSNTISSNNSNFDSDSSSTNNSSPSTTPLDLINDFGLDTTNTNNNNSNNINSINTTPTIVSDSSPALDIGTELGTDYEEGDDEESSLFHQFIRSPSGSPWPAASDPLESYYPSLASPVNLSYRQSHANDDIFSKPVVDHLVSLFFEHCFQDFDFFSPLAFLRLYVQGAANPCLLDMVCGVSSRFSDHPAVAKIPPYTSGEPYVNRVKAKMPELVSDISLDTMHTLILLTHYEYSVGRHGLAYRIEYLSAVMAPDLQIVHQYHQTPVSSASSSTPSSSVSSPSDFLNDSEAERVAIEIKIRTMTFLLISDLMSSAVSGLTPKFDHSTLRVANPSTNSSWWMERPQEPGSIPFEPVDDFSASILHKVMLPRLATDLNGHIVLFLDLVNSVCSFVRTEYTLEKWKRHMDNEGKNISSSSSSCGSGSGGGTDGRSKSECGPIISSGSSAGSVSLSVSMTRLSSSSTGVVAGVVVEQSETFQQSGSLSVPDHQRHHHSYLGREPSSIDNTFAPLSHTGTPVEYFSPIPATPDVLISSAIPRPVTPPPSVDSRPPAAAATDAETSPQWKSDLSEYTKLDSEVELWKAQLPLEFVPHHVKLSVFKTDNNVLNVGSCYYAMAILLQRPYLVPGVFLTDTSLFESDPNSNSGSSTNENNSKSRGGRQKSRGSRGGRRGRGSSMESTSSSGSSSGPLQQLQTLAEEMEGVVFTDRMTGRGTVVESSSASAVAERTPLDKCTELANRVSKLIDTFTSEQIKYKGHTLSFEVFLAATIYLTNMMTSNDAMVITRSRERLDRCYHFLDALKPYWAAAEDQMALLHGLLSSRDLRQ